VRRQPPFTSLPVGILTSAAVAVATLSILNTVVERSHEVGIGSALGPRCEGSSHWC